jgi:5-methylthioadenosine/S-adenosylhomocysteine deaminase
MRAQEVLDMATRDGARALGWWNDIGSIEVGKKADIVALDLKTPSNMLPAGHETDPEAIASSVVYSSDPRHVRATWVDGRLVFQHGRVLTIPEKKLLENVAKAQRAIAKKVSNHFS